MQVQSLAEPLRTKFLLLYKMRMFSSVLRLCFVGQLHSHSWDNTDFCVCQIDKQATTKGIILKTEKFENRDAFDCCFVWLFLTMQGYKDRKKYYIRVLQFTIYKIIADESFVLFYFVVLTEECSLASPFSNIYIIFNIDIIVLYMIYNKYKNIFNYILHLNKYITLIV